MGVDSRRRLMVEGTSEVVTMDQPQSGKSGPEDQAASHHVFFSSSSSSV